METPIIEISGTVARVKLDALRAVVANVMNEAECWTSDGNEFLTCRAAGWPEIEWCCVCIAAEMMDALDADEEAYREEMRDPGNHPAHCGCGLCIEAEYESQREHERAHSAARLG